MKLRQISPRRSRESRGEEFEEDDDVDEIAYEFALKYDPFRVKDKPSQQDDKSDAVTEVEGVDLITLNIKGYRYQMLRSTFHNLQIRDKILKTCHVYYNKSTLDHEYFLERNASCFVSIMEFLQHGVLHMPHDVCPNIFKSEMEYWNIQESVLSICCFTRLSSFRTGYYFSSSFVMFTDIFASTSPQPFQI